MYCDGIPQCPLGDDETQSGCTCEDWGLKAWKTKGHKETKCINMNWVGREPLHQSESKYHSFLHSKNSFRKHLEYKGLYQFLSLFVSLFVSQIAYHDKHITDYYSIYLCANYFAKCTTDSFCNINAIGITWLILIFFNTIHCIVF